MPCFRQWCYTQFFAEYALATLILLECLTATTLSSIDLNELSMGRFVAAVHLQYRCSPNRGIFIVFGLEIVVSKYSTHNEVDLIQMLSLKI